MTERDSGDFGVQRGFGEKAKFWLAKGLVAATLFSGVAEVKAEEITPAPANPNATHSAEVNEGKTEDNFPTTIEGYTPAPGNPMEANVNAKLNSILYGPGKESVMTDVQLMRSGENLKKYDAELVNCKPELKSFCFDQLLAIDNSAAFVNKYVTDYEAAMVKNYLTREAIIKFGETGKGLKTINFDNGLPAINLVNVSKDVESCLRQGIKDFQKDVPDFLEICYANGMRTFFQSKAGDGGTWSNYNEYGVYLYNCDKSDVKRKGKAGITKNLKRGLSTEIFGMESLILGITQDNFDAVVKEFLALKCFSAMYKKTGRDFYKDMIESAQIAYDSYLSMCGDPKKVAEIIDEVTRSNLMRPIGFNTWQEVDAALVG